MRNTWAVLIILLLWAVRPSMASVGGLVTADGNLANVTIDAARNGNEMSSS